MKEQLLGLLVVMAALAAGCAGPSETAAPVAPLPDEGEFADLTPSVTVSDQDVSDGTVTVEEVIASEPGWLVIHINRGGAPGPVIGQSAVEAGTNSDVEVNIDLSRATGQLFAMLHFDHGNEGEYEFPGDDSPVFVDDVIVNVPFQATFPIEPAVTANDQAAEDGTVTVASVITADPGWIVIHADADGAPGPVIGQAPVIVGYNPDVVVEIDPEQATPTLYAMLHLDVGAEGTYEFPNGDPPVFDASDNVVVVPFAFEKEQSSSSGGLSGYEYEGALDEGEKEDESGGEAEMSDGEVLVVDSSFRIQVITVPVGTTVTWVYSGALPHTVTADDGSFGSGTLGSGDTFTHTFEQAGTFAYYCRFHGGEDGSGMSGVVNVTEG